MQCDIKDCLKKATNSIRLQMVAPIFLGDVRSIFLALVPNHIWSAIKRKNRSNPLLETSDFFPGYKGRGFCSSHSCYHKGCGQNLLTALPQ